MAVTFTFRRKESFLSLPKEIKIPILFSLLMAASNGFIAIAAYSSLQPIIPLFYTLPQLDQQLMPKPFVFIIPALAVILFLMNLFCSKILSKIDLLMMKLFTGISVFIQFLLLFSLIRILVIL